MEIYFLAPPIAFLILLVVIILLSFIFSRWAFREKPQSEESQNAYSCGEEFSEHLIQPDYSQFFPFAFFFTILHVVAMVVATVPTETIDIFAIAIIYIIGAIIGLLILLRK